MIMIAVLFSLSRQIIVLEKELRVRFFDCSKIALTGAGKMFY